jgi:ComF family protein
VLYLSPYQNKDIKALILENKFYHNQTATKLLATLLSIWLSEQSQKVTLVPIPLSRQREKERGYNQVLEVLRQLPVNPSYAIESKLLKRTKNIVPQTSLQRAERLKNTIDIFEVDESIVLTSELVVLIDDVVTTGATLKAGATALMPFIKSEVKIICLALAH